jgi:hypothetical protein
MPVYETAETEEDQPAVLVASTAPEEPYVAEVFAPRQDRN